MASGGTDALGATEDDAASGVPVVAGVTLADAKKVDNDDGDRDAVTAAVPEGVAVAVLE
jgi:hypothetical protein